MTGHHWGAGKQSMLKIYRTLIRPKMEYAMEIFYTANKASWKKLEIIQSTCLRLACGAMRSTAVDSLQQECGELPLKLRRKRAVLRYTAKLKMTTDNPASTILDDSWHLHYAKWKNGREPIQLQTKDFISGSEIQHSEIIHEAPWKRYTKNWSHK